MNRKEDRRIEWIRGRCTELPSLSAINLFVCYLNICDNSEGDRERESKRD